MNPASTSGRRVMRGLLVLLAVAVVGIAIELSRESNDAPNEPSTMEESPVSRSRKPLSKAEQRARSWSETIRSEQLISRLTDSLRDLTFAVLNLELPDERSRRQFWPLVISVVDLELESTGAKTKKGKSHFRTVKWPTSDSPTDVYAVDLGLWRPLFDQIEYFQNAEFSIHKGSFPRNDPSRFDADVVFGGLARMTSGEWSWIRTNQTVRWRLVSGGNPEKAESWKIVEWHTQRASRMSAPGMMFRDVLDQAIPDSDQLERARVSIHERKVAEDLLARQSDPNYTPKERFMHPAGDRHPGIAVVDLDRDGFDDIYAMARWGPNQFFRNRGDGTFEEVASKLGLDISDRSSSAVFADFDNDGDSDLFLGRTLTRSAYFENVEGHFIDRSADRVDRPLPYLASSVSSVDYDGDGLLDVYVSTYAASETGSMMEPYVELYDRRVWAARYSAKEAPETLLSSIGPPNVLLHNIGDGRFEIVDDPGPLKAFRHTYQSTWADFDRDGDTDVYLANDFAPDNMIRNEGDGRFTDVTKEMGFRELGLGMSVTWGDYDHDGMQDLYVSNMYSSAGSRITRQLGYLDRRFSQIAQGSYLYRNEGEWFRRISKFGSSTSNIQKTGWSWGSQFVDVDNDSFLDIVVLNGYYTVPPEAGRAGDT